MIKPIVNRIVRLLSAWVLAYILGGGILAEYGIQKPSWGACLSAILLLETAGEILRGEIPKPLDK
jgi:hypothetical protein